MLVLSRTTEEAIQIGPDIEVVVTFIGASYTGMPKVRLGITAPDSVTISRTRNRSGKRARDGALGAKDGHGEKGRLT